MGFIYDIRHAAAAENISVYKIVIYWTSRSAGLCDQRSHFKCTAQALVLGAVHACCIERQLITLQLELAGGQLELELELAI